jgi:hypothetical protein
MHSDVVAIEYEDVSPGVDKDLRPDAATTQAVMSGRHGIAGWLLGRGLAPQVPNGIDARLTEYFPIHYAALHVNRYFNGSA